MLFGSSVPYEAVDEILRTGGNQRYGVQRIISHHQHNGENFPAMLKQEFLGLWERAGGRGIVLDTFKYAAWYDKDGIHVARGESVSNQDSVHFTWEQAADRIDYLLTHGLYQPQIVVDQSADRDRLELAEKFIFLWREKNKEHPHPFFMDEAYFTTYKGFPDESAAIAEALKYPTIMKQTVENLRNFARAYYADKSLLMAHYTQPARVYKRLEKFLNDPLVYPATTYFPSERQFFITRDEIDDTIW
ncbi:MAG: hypothetical protein MJ077_11470, partial [Oscillospiraceae bacterium]|nr:hypothetical protein [Oscillospiraceae bacterium]